MERFLRAAERWADHIIIADQGSTDATRAIAERSSKTIVVSNDSHGYDEGERHRVILEAARSISGPRAIFAVDADEALSANVTDEPVWETALASPPGTVFTAEWINYLPAATSIWKPKSAIPFGFIDDGRSHNPGRFHVERVVVNSDDPKMSLDPIKLLHFQYLDWARMKSKQRRYQINETLHNPGKRATHLYRQYHRMDAVPKSQVQAADRKWLAGYEAAGVDMTTVVPQDWYWTDHEALELLQANGTDKFRRIDIWDVDWATLAEQDGQRGDQKSKLANPQSRLDQLVLGWLAKTQRRGPDRPATKLVDRLLRFVGW